MNEFLADHRDDPRELLKDRALKLAEEKKIDFMVALEEIKTAEPELVERCARWTRD